ncbi:MAG: CHAT domain-containing protein [Blastocatellia bacterium]|nr:CHAT domain-containing protein [Blastocatellia bacterium]
MLLGVWLRAVLGGIGSAQEMLAPLAPGRPVERNMAGGESHQYQITLSAGQYFSLRAEQRGIDFSVRIFSGDGGKLLEIDTLNSTQGPEVAAVIAAESGSHRIEILSTNREAPPGQYVLTIQALRAAEEPDRRWIGAQQAYLDGMQLRARQTEEGRRLAIPKFEEALRQWQEANDGLMAAHSLYAISSCHRLLSQRGQAIAALTQALSLLRSVGEEREEAPVLINLGIIRNELGEPRVALEDLTLAQQRMRALADPYGEARALTNLGSSHSSLGDAEKALEAYQMALPVWQRHGNRQQSADALAGIGQAHDMRGEWQQALERFEQALALYQAIGHRRGEASVINNLGVIHGRLGDLPKELEFYKRALDLWRSMKNYREVAITLANIGTVEAALNDPAAALTHYNQALQISREEGDLGGEAVGLQYLGEISAASGEPRKALVWFEQSLSLLRKAGNLWREAYVLRNLGALHLSMGEREKAREYATQALSLFDSIGDRSGQSLALYEIARVDRDAGRLEEARRGVEEAIRRGEAVRADVGSRQLRASYLASLQKYYSLQIDLLMRLDGLHPEAGYEALALQVSERARARGLLEMLVESGARIREGADPALLDRERDLSRRINARALTLMQLNSVPHRAEQAESLKRELSQLENEYEAVQAGLRRASPHYAAITQPQSLTIGELQRQLDSETALLEYSLGEDRSYVWAVTSDSIAGYALPGREEVDRAARQVYELLVARTLRKRNETLPQQRERVALADRRLPEAASLLSRMILQPVAAALGKKRLVLVTDGALQYVPFGMLPVPGSAPGTPLILDHEIVSLPSASTLAMQRQELAGRASASRQIAMIADPVFTDKDDRTRTRRAGVRPAAGTRSVEHEEESGVLMAGGFSIPRLPYTRQEAERILALVPGAANMKRLDFSANRAAVMDPELGQYRYLHFATHGLMDSERPGLSALVLSLVDENGKPQDGFLRAHEIYNLRLPADLVVLSACQTGLGKEIRGEGLVGLTRGFMYAGAARVAVSLWNVNDRATAELMGRFYQKMLKDGARPAAALRAAQIEMLRTSQWNAPYFWAAFALQGEWR